jgi:2-oxoglutarate dehydrogenase E1 component
MSNPAPTRATPPAQSQSVSLETLVATSQLSGGNAAFVEDLYEAYLLDKNSVSATWQQYFASLGGTQDVRHSEALNRIGEASKSNVRVIAGGVSSDAPSAKQAGLLRVINSHRTRGHLRANIDPLGMMAQPEVKDLAMEYHGFSAADLSEEFEAAILVGNTKRKLSETLAMLKSTYLATIGAEYMHITDYDQRRWFQERLEGTAGQFGFDAAKKVRILERLTAAEGLERYLHNKYVGQKRFSLEGGDSMVPLLDELVQRAGSAGVKDVVVGMAHRGRLNVLINTVGKPPRELFDAFEGKHDHVDDPAHSGDVKYHLGFSADVKTAGGTVHVALGFNPSHLEIINPVVAGSVRARQTRREDRKRERVVPVLIHGDAAFAGQGVVPELLNMSQARGYAVGGTIHIVINNQVGFTTSKPEDARSTFYCTDVAKMISAPVLHVNGDDPEAVVYCAQLAFDYRQAFKRDIVIDLVCYRRHGHNEADEPAATQPVMYQNIRARKTTRELYAAALEQTAVIAAGDAKNLQEQYRLALEKGAPVAPGLTTPDEDGKATDWRPYLSGDLNQDIDTGGDKARLVALANQLNTLPKHLTLHARVAKVYEDRAKMTAGELRMDWGYAETLAYATLLKEGYELRISGQDAGRGTFFHRHAVLHDQPTANTYMPLAGIAGAEKVEIIDSVLSEEAVMAFEYGFATAEPRTLTIWEAQFGDFCNGAQVVIDQFLSSGEAKWGRQCGLVLFLPHGFEGQGPEHSSARLERFLQLCALNNMQVCTPTTPAQMFHMLRRQMLRHIRKPLVVMTPKSMLRNKLSTSTMDDLAGGKFHNVIADSNCKKPESANRVVLCAGKVYYDLLEAAEKSEAQDVAIVRVEQLYPFPRNEVSAELERFPNAKDVVWCQEEPLNQGAWFQIRHHLEASLSEHHKLRYAGRDRAAAPACGHSDQHQAEQAKLVSDALSRAG